MKQYETLQAGFAKDGMSLELKLSYVMVCTSTDSINRFPLGLLDFSSSSNIYGGP